MRFLVALLAVVSSTVLQTICTGMWPRASSFFDLPLMVVIYYSLAKGPTGALLAGAGAGLLQDSLAGTLLGVNALSKALVGYLAGVLGFRFALNALLPRILVLATATVLCRSIEVGTLAIMGRRLAYSPYPYLLISVAGNCLIGAPLLKAFRRQAPQ